MVFTCWIWTKWYQNTYFSVEIGHCHWNLPAGSATLLQPTTLDDILLTDCNKPVVDLELQELKPPSDHQSSSNTDSLNETDDQKFVRRSTRKRKRPDCLGINSVPVEAPAIKNKKSIRKSPNGSPIKLFCRKEDLALMTCVNHLGPNWKEIKERMSSFGFERNSKSSFSDRWNRLQEKIYSRFCYKPPK